MKTKPKSDASPDALRALHLAVIQSGCVAGETGKALLSVHNGEPSPVALSFIDDSIKYLDSAKGWLIQARAALASRKAPRELKGQTNFLGE